MWAALIILAHIFGPPQAGGQQDFELCTGKTKSTREESIAACHRVTFKEVLDKKSIGKAYLLLARWADKPAGAISYLDQAIAQDPENGDYYGERGFQYHLLGDYDRALSEHETALALNPDSSYTYGVRAFTLEQKGDDAGALADLDRAIAIEPQEYAFYTSKADIYLRQGDTSAALAALDQGLKFNPDRVEIYSAKAEIYRKIGDAKGELAALNCLIEFKPGETGLLHRALTYERLGRLDLAIADYDALLALDPHGKFYRERRAALLKARDEGAAPPVPAVVVGDAPGKSKEPARGAAPLKKADRNAAPALECRVYVPGADLTVSVPCAK